MGSVIPFRVSAKAGVRPPPPSPVRKGSGKRPCAGINVYADPEPDVMLQRVKRNVLHGILSAWTWELTTGLFRTIFAEGGVFRIRCKPRDVAAIEKQIALRLPDLLVRRVRLSLA